LERLSISDTDVDSGLEYLSDSIETFYCTTDCKKDAKCKSIYNLFANDQGVVETEGYGYIKNFPQKFQDIKRKISQGQQQAQVLQPTNLSPKK